MPAPRFDKLGRELRAAGAAPSVVERILAELSDHCLDAEAEWLAKGFDPAEAERRALTSLGSVEAIVGQVMARSELLDWRHRWPQSARCVDSFAHCVAWPAAPFVYCASHPAGMVRWSLSFSLGAFVTATILFTLQLMIS